MVCTAGAGAQELVPLWKDDAIPNYQAQQGQEQTIRDHLLVFRNVQKPALEVFLPPEHLANGMAVLVLPGGGYSQVSYGWEGTTYAEWFNSLGIAAFVLKYRMPQAESVITSYKAPIQDAQRAIRYIRFRAAEFNIDKDKVGVIGSSAGGHLASTLGSHLDTSYYEPRDDIDRESTHPDFMMLIYPVISMQAGVAHKGSKNALLGKSPSADLVTQFSNELQVTEETPATFIVHSGDDKAVPVENSIRLYQALVRKGVPTTLHVFPEGGHGFSTGQNRPNAPDWTCLAAWWLQTLSP